MKYWIIGLLFVSTWVQALPLSKEGKKEAALFNDFLQATYAQRAADPQRFALLGNLLEQAPDSAYLKQLMVAESLVVDVPELAQPYADFIEQAQDDPEAWFVYASYQLQQNHVEQALQAYEKALELDPDDERVLSQYIALLAATDPAKAENTLLGLLQSHPDSAVDIYREIGRMYMYHQKYPQALEAFNKAIELDPRQPQLRVERAGVYEKTSQYFLMLHELEELEKMGYVTAQTLAQMGSVFILVSDYAQAEKRFTQALALEPDNIPANYFLAMLAQQRGNYAQAISFLKNSADYEKSAEKQVQVSYCQRKMNQPQASFQTISHVYRLFGQDSEVTYLYAIALYEQGKYAQSARILKSLVEKAPQEEQVRLKYAFALEGQKKYRALEEQLTILLEQNPRNAEALNLYAYSLALRGERLDQAADYIARALAIYPKDISLIDTQVWVFYRQGKYQQAADLLQNFTPQIYQENPEIAYHAGMVYAALGQKSQAKPYLQLAVQGGWKPARKALKKID